MDVMVVRNVPDCDDNVHKYWRPWVEVEPSQSATKAFESTASKTPLVVVIVCGAKIDTDGTTRLRTMTVLVL